MNAQTLILLAVTVVLLAVLVLELMKPRHHPCQKPACQAEAFLAAMTAGTHQIARATQLLEATSRKGCAVDRAATAVRKPPERAPQKQEPARKRRR